MVCTRARANNLRKIYFRGIAVSAMPVQRRRYARAASEKKSDLGSRDCLVKVQQDSADAGPGGQFRKLIL